MGDSSKKCTIRAFQDTNLHDRFSTRMMALV